MNPMKDALQRLLAMTDEMQTLGRDALGEAPAEEKPLSYSDGPPPPSEPGVTGPDDVPPGGEDPETGLPEAAIKILSGNRHPPMPEKKGMRFTGQTVSRPRGRPKKLI